MTCGDCGYSGSPIFWRGRSHGCPRCARMPTFDKAVEALTRAGYRIKIRARRIIPPGEGRNRPCPCGSGIKWKKCHGQ